MATNDHNRTSSGEPPAGVSPETPRSFLVDDNPRQTIDNCLRMIRMLQRVDLSGDGISASAEMGMHMVMDEVCAALHDVSDRRPQVAAAASGSTAPKDAARQFDEKHFLLLRGIIVTARGLFREVNEPSDDPENTAEDLSCALDTMVEQLDVALQDEGLS